MTGPGRRVSLLALIALVAAIALAAAACGGDDGGGEDVTGDLTAQELLDRSAEEAAAAESFRIALEAAGSVDAAESGVPGAGLLAGRVQVSGEGPVQPPDRASIDLRVELSGPALQGNVTRVGDEVYLGVLGQDFRVDLPPEQVALLDLGELYPTLAGWASDPEIAGREEVDGTETVRVTAGLDPAAALDDLGPLLGTDGVTPEQARQAVSTGTLEAWIGTGDLLPRRVRVVLQGDASGLGAGVSAVDLDLTADLSQYGEPVDVQAPEDARQLDLDQLGGLVGG